MSRTFFQAIRSRDLERLRSMLAESPELVDSLVPVGEDYDHIAGGKALRVVTQARNVVAVRLLVSEGERGRRALR